MRFNLIIQITFSLIFFTIAGYAQTGNQGNKPGSSEVIGLIKYDGYSILVLKNGLKAIDSKDSTDNYYTEYYRNIYGDSVGNPNHVVESNDKISFIPFLSGNRLQSYGIDSIDNFSLEQFYHIFQNNSFDKEGKNYEKLKNRLITVIKDLRENTKK